MQFLEKSITYSSIEQLIEGLFSGVKQFKLDCCAWVHTKEGDYWFASNEIISPIEKELLSMADREARFLDFGQRTIVNYPMISLLVRNMPLDNMERYGRYKDLLPIFLSAFNVKLSSIETQIALNQQSKVMLESFNKIRKNLYEMGSTIINNREDGKSMTDELIQALHADLLGMGLEEDQEDYLIERLDVVVNEVMVKLDAGAEVRSVLSFILENLKLLVEKQECLLEEYNSNMLNKSDPNKSEMLDSVELF